MKTLKIENLSAKIKDKEVLSNINLELKTGEVNVIVGHNGAGKSTLGNVIMGNPVFKTTQGKILLNQEDITADQANKRAQKGIFLSFQHPVEIEGVSMLNFLKSSYENTKDTSILIPDFIELLEEKMFLLGLESKFKSRDVNLGFSGGEKKRSEILQLLLLEPDFIILDEIDSGLDVDGLKLVAQAIQALQKKKEICLIIISHYNKIFDYFAPDNVYLLEKGLIKQKGGIEILEKIEKEGFNSN